MYLNAKNLQCLRNGYTLTIFCQQWLLVVVFAQFSGSISIIYGKLKFWDYNQAIYLYRYFQQMKKQRYQPKYPSYDNNKNGQRNYRSSNKNNTDFHNSPNYYEDYSYKNKYHKLFKTHQDLLQRKTSCEETLKEYMKEAQQLKKIQNKINAMEELEKIEDPQNLILTIQQKNLQTRRKLQQLQQVSGKTQIQQQSWKQNILVQLRDEETNQHELCKKNQKSKYVQGMEHILKCKEQELKKLQDEEQQNQYEKIKELIEIRRNSCLAIKQEKQKTKEGSKKYKKKRFEISQEMSKQERVSVDLAQSIKEINEKIKIEAQFDEKLRIENLKKMQEKEAKKLHPEDLPYQDLRKLKQKHHELKLMLLQVKQTLEQEKLEGQNLVSAKNVEQIDSKIQKTQNFIQKYRNIENQNKQLKNKIKEIKQEKKKAEKHKHGTFDDLEDGIDHQEAELIEIKTTVKILKKESELLNSRLRQFTQMVAQSEISREEESEKQEDSTKNEKDTSERYQLSQSEDDSKSYITQQSKRQRSKNHNPMRKKVKANRHIPELSQKDKNVSEYRLVKKRSQGQFYFTIIYLVLAFLAACFYNKARVWFLMNIGN